jgi:hypothetical protein
MAPELLAVGRAASKAADVYAFGMLAYEVRVRHDISIGYVIHQ